ncbi:tryptophan synthase subunit alpha, partial [Streptomyces sp. NPDC055037]
TRQDVETVGGCGADAVIIGSAGVARIERSLAQGDDVVDGFRAFVRSVSPNRSITPETTGS